MVTRKKGVKKSLKTTKIKPKAVKLSRRPAAKTIKRPAAKKAVDKTVIRSKKPAAKVVISSKKKPAKKASTKTSTFKKILTAEGWKRLFFKNKASKS